MKGSELMTKRDLDSIKRDMSECMGHVTSTFKGSDVPLDASAIALLTKTMFDDYRGNSERDLLEHKTDAEKELLRLEHQLNEDR